MSEDYQHACERAELLGLPKPSEEEWRQTLAAQSENRCDDDDDGGALQDLDHADETAGRVGGGLDELNSILSTTQKKINRFKTVCGSLGTLLKGKVSSRGSTPQHKSDEPNPCKQEEIESAPDEVVTLETSAEASGDTAADATNNPASDGIQPKQLDLSQKMGSHLDKLDSLISKAENAQYSMQHQTKQMRKFLK
ncbi:uncharacterized protein [Linepithema humile]|uniref:uncharacterized protein n=1 Tax=Linepithema humile TaxID=83485 RepID=UPI0006231223|nr:PREDICTED: uncharacterized protein LOC105678267 [Linepithema humile]